MTWRCASEARTSWKVFRCTQTQSHTDNIDGIIVFWVFWSFQLIQIILLARVRKLSSPYSQSTCQSVRMSGCLDVCPSFQNASSPRVFVRLRWFFNTMVPYLGKINVPHISTTDRPIDFVLDPRVGFSGTADRMDLLPVSPNPRWRLLMTSSRNNRCRKFGAKYLGNEAR